MYKAINNRQISGEKRTKTNIKAAYIFAVSIGIIIIAATILLLNNNENYRNTALSDTQYENTSKPTEKVDAMTADEDITFNGFILATYSAEQNLEYLSADYLQKAQQVVLTPDIEISLAKYSPAMSSVPGFPFTIGIVEQENNFDINEIRVFADKGQFNTWNRITGVVSIEGQSDSINPGETIYWAPGPSDDSDIMKKITITVEALSDNIVVGRQYIYIIQRELGYYSATVGELELLSS